MEESMDVHKVCNKLDVCVMYLSRDIRRIMLMNFFFKKYQFVKFYKNKKKEQSLGQVVIM